MKPNSKGHLDWSDVVKMCGDIPEWKVALILQTNAMPRDLEAALLWAQGESDVAGEERVPLSGPAAAIYDILTLDEEEDLREGR